MRTSSRRRVMPRLSSSAANGTACLRVIASASQRHVFRPEQLTSHGDRGSVQIAKDLYELYDELGIVRSLSRPCSSR